MLKRRTPERCIGRYRAGIRPVGRGTGLRPAPDFAANNDEVFQALLGMSEFLEVHQMESVEATSRASCASWGVAMTATGLSTRRAGRSGARVRRSWLLLPPLRRTS